MTVSELTGKLNSRKLVVYGTGFVSGMLMRALEARGLDENIAAFAVTDAGGAQHEYHGRRVLSFHEVKDDESLEDALVLVAVHGAVAGEIISLLEGSGMEYLEIYPYIPALLYGDPLDDDAVIYTADAIRNQDSSYLWLALRYAVLEKMGIEDSGAAESIYKKAIALHTSEKTAAARLERFRSLAESIKDDGYREDSKVFIDENGRIIDGLHRIAAAAYFGIEKLPARIYPASDMYDIVIGKENKMDEQTLREGGLTEEEVQIIKDAQKRMTPSKISVIVPAYNVEGYIDECMQTVVAQTFTDFEVILINDGSADGTPAKCEAWAARDGRIRYISTPNRGVSAARNMGIEKARGKYLAFVDPDDWLDPSYLEKLYEAAREIDADFAECDIYRYDNRNGTKIYRSCGSAFGVEFSKEEHMIYGPTASYKSISKKSLWTDNDLRFPSCSFESPAVYPLVVALSEKTARVPEALYYYRRYREGSLIETAYGGKDGRPDPGLGTDAMRSMIAEAKRLGIYEKFEDTFERVVKYRLSDIMAMQYHRRSPEEFAKMSSDFRSLMSELFPDGMNGAYAVWGGYNLNKVLLHLPALQDPDLRMNFSSIASLAGERPIGDAPGNKNRYRQMMLEREWTRSFAGVLRDRQPDILFMDLLEERNPVMKTDGGAYITLSDAFLGSDRVDMAEVGHICEGEERISLMRSAAESFARMAESCAPDMKIVIVKNYLAERIGDIMGSRDHDDISEIRRVNSELKKYYDILIECMPHALVVETEECTPYITDEMYEYGALPSHLNEVVNRKIARVVERALEK